MNLKACQEIYMSNNGQENFFSLIKSQNDVFLMNEHLTYAILQQARRKNQGQLSCMREKDGEKIELLFC
jgi:hypothetical protein